ncbi:MAG TPA: carotenoid oxygenase family protein [Candidatus Sulfotelmatobacter sp.]|nr:carotenoid oxygenase family protein [Candidatus Sulfotelmatobacter sp.]
MNSTLAATSAGFGLGLASQNHEIAVDRLPLSGRLPDWLTGTLLRNGPARFEVGAERYRHWFDGLAMIHRFGIADGAVSYRNRFLRTPAFLEAERSGRIASSEFGTNPQRSFFERLRTLGQSSNGHNANVNIVPFAGDYLALTETPEPVRFDGTTLETKGALAYDDQVRGQVTTAHTVYDPVRRATFNIVIEMGRNATYKFVRIDDGTLRRTVVATVTTDQPCYLHAFSATAEHLILVEYPLIVRPLDLLLMRKPFIENYRWEPGRGTRIHVVRKDGGALVGTFSAEAMFAFHHINAYDEADAIVVDIAAYDDATIVDDLSLDHLLQPDGPHISRGEFRRYRLTPGRETADVEILAVETTELPRVARERIGQPYRYAYGIDWPAGAFDHIVKVDTHTRDVISWTAPNTYVGEPVFVGRPGAQDEDDGVLLCVGLEAAADRSALLVLDARTLTELARAEVPQTIPYGFHGMFH